MAALAMPQQSTTVHRSGRFTRLRPNKDLASGHAFAGRLKGRVKEDRTGAAERLEVRG
jgi:hypothetical protein